MKHIYVVHHLNGLNHSSTVAFTSETDAFEYIMSWWEGYLYIMFLNFVDAATRDPRICDKTPVAYAKYKLDRVIQNSEIFRDLAITRIPLVD